MHFRYGVHRHSFRCFRKYFFPALLLSASQLLLWAVIFAALYFLYQKISYSALYAAIPMLLVITIYRFFVAHQYRKMIKPSNRRLKPLHRLILPAVYRLITGALWAIPFSAMTYRVYSYLYLPPFNAFEKDFTAIGAFFTRPATPETTQLLVGTILFFSLYLLCFLVFVFGWRRGVCFDFLQSQHLSFTQSVKKTRTLRRLSAATRFVNTLLHALLLIPVIILPLLPIVFQLNSVFSAFTGKILSDFYILSAYINSGIISDTTLLLSLAIFLLLYFPTLPFRKLHNAAAVVMRHE